MIDIDAIREKCSNWDDDSGCDEEFPETCPFHVECKDEDEKTD